jgi:hypothetical protein
MTLSCTVKRFWDVCSRECYRGLQYLEAAQTTSDKEVQTLHSAGGEWDDTVRAASHDFGETKLLPYNMGLAGTT